MICSYSCYVLSICLLFLFLSFFNNLLSFSLPQSLKDDYIDYYPDDNNPHRREKLTNADKRSLQIHKSIEIQLSLFRKNIIQLIPLSGLALFCHSESGLEILTFTQDFNQIESTTSLQNVGNKASKYSISPKHNYLLEVSENYFKVFDIRNKNLIEIFSQDIQLDNAVERTTEYISIEFGKQPNLIP